MNKSVVIVMGSQISEGVFVDHENSVSKHVLS